jgi:hypothetical protein
MSSDFRRKLPKKPSVIKLPHYELTLDLRDGSLAFSEEMLEGTTSPQHNGKPKLFIGPAPNDKSKLALYRDAAEAGKARQFKSPSTRSILATIDDAELYPHVVSLARELQRFSIACDLHSGFR